MAGTQLVVFTRNLRLRDNPTLVAAAAGDRPIVALFVIDDALGAAFRNANRSQFLVDCLHDLDQALTMRGGRLTVARGDWATEVARAAAHHGAAQVHVSADVGAVTVRRAAALASHARHGRFTVHPHPGVTVVDPTRPRTGAGTPYRVFTPYYRAWLAGSWRAVLEPPARIRFADTATRSIGVPELRALTRAAPSPHAARGGEQRGIAQLRAYVASGLADYATARDDLAADATSHISAHLHFGSLSPLEVASRLGHRPGGAAFVRQLAWRDFFHHVLAQNPRFARDDVRPRGDVWNHDHAHLTAWCRGTTGFPVVDAGMRQLATEGTMHNRARMIVASFLTKHLYLDWRVGAQHFMDLLVDADVAQNQLNWQWVAGTGTDPNPFRVFNPTLQGGRYDPDGRYVARYVPELRGVAANEIHDPSPLTRAARGYPPPIVEHRAAVARYRAVQQANRAARGATAER